MLVTRLWKKLRKNVKDNQMAKNTRKQGKSVRHGNSPSPYMKYNKYPYSYGEIYKNNYLQNGVLYRNGKPVYHKDEYKVQAAE